MAQIIDTTGSKFIGTPMVIRVRSGNISDATFQRVKLEVTVNGAYQFDFTTPVSGGGEVVSFDIASALRAVADRYQFTATPNPISNAGYPSYSYEATARDEYLLNGVAQTGTASDSTSQSGLYIGTLSDRERLAGQLSPSQFSRKPTSSPEPVSVGMTWVKGGTGSSPSARTVDITASTTGTSEYYPVSASRDAYELRFINTYGVHESLHIHCLAQQEMSVQTDRFTIARQESVIAFSRGMALKHNDHERWRMSSPPLDRQWLQYYLHEPLMARWAWLRVDGQWLQVHILPDETVKGLDRQKAGPITVEFTIEFDINGSPFA